MTHRDHDGKLDLDPALVAQGARAGRARPGSRSWTWPAATPPSSVERAVLRLAGLDRRRPGRHPVGQPARRRGRGRRRARARRGAAGVARDGPRGHRRPDPAGAEGGGRVGPLRAAARAALTAAPRRARSAAVGGRHQADRPQPGRARPPGQAARRPEAAAVDLPDRGDRRHLRGHPAGAGGRPGRRRRDRGDPLDRTVAAGLRARGRDPGGLRRHVRHAGELPADAGRAGRVVAASSAATSG